MQTSPLINMIGCFPINVSATCHACRVEREREREKVTKKERKKERKKDQKFKDEKGARKSERGRDNSMRSTSIEPLVTSKHLTREARFLLHYI